MKRPVGHPAEDHGPRPESPRSLDARWFTPFRRYCIVGSLVTLVASLLFYHRVFFTPGKIDVHGHVEMVVRFAEGKGSIPGNFLYYALIYALTGLQSGTTQLWLAATAVLAASTAARFAVDYRIIAHLATAAPGAPVAESPRLRPRTLLLLTAALTLAFSLPTLAALDPKPRWYIGQLPPNIWHNSTTILVMPFAAALFWVSHRNLIRPTHRRDCWIAGLCVLNILAKPSFFMAFAPMYPLFLLIRHGLRRGTWIRMWPVALGILALGAQYYITFTRQVGNRYRSEPELTIAPFEIWSHFSSNIPLSVLASILFPLLYVALYRRTLRREPMVVYALALLGIALVMMALLAETGPRRLHANFFWQSYVCNHLLFLATTSHLALRIRCAGVGARERWLLGALALHVVAGIAYIARMYIQHEFL